MVLKMFRNFVNIGPGRCATSWLYESLLEHPDIVMSSSKETNFFNCEFKKGIDWYLKQFSNCDYVFGEISNMYFANPEVLNRIFDFNKHTKIIINLRDPLSLIKSIIQFGHRRGLSFDSQNIFEIEYSVIMSDGRECDSKMSLAESLDYSQIAKNYITKFGTDNVYFLIFERIAIEPDEVLEEIYEFLNVDSNFKPKTIRNVINPASSARNIFVAKTSRLIARLLRKMGFLVLLDSLKRSIFVHKLIFKDFSDTSRSMDDLIFSDEELSYINDCKNSFIDLLPVLKKWW